MMPKSLVIFLYQGSVALLNTHSVQASYVSLVVSKASRENETTKNQ